MKQTNQVFEGIADYVKNFTVSQRDMTKYIIGAISEMDTPLTPMAKGMRSLNAYMSGITEEDFQRERDQVLGAPGGHPCPGRACGGRAVPGKYLCDRK